MSLQLHLLCTVFLVHIFSVLASEESFSIPADEKATVCGLDDFEIDTLAKANYWSVSFMREHLNKCLVPDGYETHQISSCQFHFSVCRAIPEGVCGGHSNSTACQEVVTKDGHRHYYSIGESRESYEFTANGYPSSDGFFTIRQGHAVSHHRSSSCHGRFKISLKFVCDRDRVWDPYSRDASTHVYVIVITDHCHLEIEFGYSGACQKVAPTLAPAMNSCRLPPYNLTGLTSQKYWIAHVPDRYCYNDGFSSPLGCTFYFSFCQPLPAEAKLGRNCAGAAVCQHFNVESLHPPYKEVFYSMGQFETFTRFFFNGKRPGGGFHMDIVNGSIPGCQHTNRTRVSLACNSSVVWNSRDLSRIIQVEKTNSCEYELILPYSGACSTISPSSTFPVSSSIPLTTLHFTTSHSVNSTSIHPHPNSTVKPPWTSSHHLTNSTAIHSSTPIRNSTIRTSTPMHTLSSHHTINSTSAKHPSSTPTGNSTTVTQSSIQVTTLTSSRTSTVPTASPHVVTTNATPVNPDQRIILGLTAGVVLSAVLAIVLLVMIIIAVRILIKRKHKLKFLKMES